MRGDFSRDSFDRTRHARGVLMQQGRVQLDADWNEAQAVQGYRAETTAVDVIGAVGSPRGRSGFLVGLDGDGVPSVGAGRVYLDGMLVENDADGLPLTAQPFLPGYTMPTEPGTYLAVLDARLRECTALDDPSTLEVALGGPDTAVRETVIWQVKLVRLGPPGPGATCAGSTLPAGVLDRVPGGLRARAERDTTGDRPCSIAPQARFSGVENQLYRIEIHRGGAGATASFKWSRDNGARVADWLADDAGLHRIKIGGAGRDGLPLFGKGEWVELLDDTNEFYDETTDPDGRPGVLVELGPSTEEQVLVPTIAPPARGQHHPRVRGWDMGSDALPIATADPDDFIDVENGIQVQFSQTAYYRAGDYWLIPARTVTATIDWPDGGPRAPDGIRHHYARLAVLTTEDGAAWEVLDDCRTPFPALNDLRAADVGFDNTGNDLPDATTVQDALDVLSDRINLKKHNQSLHGWGIVNGLRMTCGPNSTATRRVVTLHPGYAIDDDGNDIDVAAPAGAEGIEIDVLDLAGDLGDALDPQGTGDVALILDPTRPSRVRAEKHRAPAKDDPPLIEGTLLLDFWNDSVVPVKKFLDEELKSSEDTPADPARQRMAVLVNLANQTVNSKSGQQVFLSRREDDILRGFYAGLRKVLTNATFCAMFENARPLPGGYVFASRPENDIDVVFGTGGHAKMRLRPGSTEAYTFGNGANPLKPRPQINRYDLDRGLLLAEIDPVAGTQKVQTKVKTATTDPGTGAVQDIAFSPDGAQIYVAIANRSEDNTIFRTGRITASGIDWTPPTTICGVKLVSLATTAADKGSVYAVGVHKLLITEDTGKGTDTRFEWRSSGLHKINPELIDPSNVPKVAIAADHPDPTGPLVIDPRGRAVLGTVLAGRPVTTFTALVRVDLVAGTTAWQTVLDPHVGTDGLTFDTTAAATREVYAVLREGASGAKFLAGFRMGDGAALERVEAELGDAAVSITSAQNRILVAEMDANAVRMFDPGKHAFEDAYRVPTQVGPAAIAGTERGGIVVLNQLSNTLLTVPPDLITREFHFDTQAMAGYRTEVIDAFTDLAAGFLQYGKDALAEHFLIKPPPAPGDHPLRLGVVSIRENQVYKVCNFTGRRYVKSFPAIGYWLSVLPIQPFIAHAVQWFACLTLPDLVRDKTLTTGGDLFPTTSLISMLEGLQAFDLSSFVSDLRGRLDVTGQTTLLAARAMRPPVPPPGGAANTVGSIVAQPVDRVTEMLEARGITVKHARFDPRIGTAGAASVAGLFRGLRPGQEVTLCEEDGRVRFFSVSNASPLTGRVHDLEAATAVREEELRDLRETVATTRVALADTTRLAAELTRARTQLEDRDRLIADLTARVDRIERADG